MDYNINSYSKFMLTIDINDNAPEVSPITDTAPTAEDTEIGTLIYSRFVANDIDSGTNAEFQ